MAELDYTPTSIYFWLAFTMLMGVFSLIYKKRKLRNYFLLACSLLFYYSFTGNAILILGISIVANYCFGLLIQQSKSKNKNVAKILFLVSGIIFNLIIFLQTKYGYTLAIHLNNFLNLENWNLFGFALVQKENSSIILSIGLTLFSIQALSYLIDIYRNRIKACLNILYLALYMCFFPSVMGLLLAKPKDFFLQLKNHYQLSTKEFSLALFFIICGFVKKLLFADNIAMWVQPMFDPTNSYSGFEHLLAIYGSALQLYCEFSSFSDIAIGISIWMGFQLPLNFDSPYRSTSISSFWKRWHISLSEWIKDYIYIPMGGSKKGILRSCLNSFICALVGGLWYGISLPFLIWGLLNALILSIEKAIGISSKSKYFRFAMLFRVFIVFNIVCIGLSLFRFTTIDNALLWFKNIFTYTSFDLIIEILYANYYIFILILIGFIIHFIPFSAQNYMRQLFVRNGWGVKILICILVMLLIAIL